MNLRVMLVDESEERSEHLEQTLRDLGHKVVARVRPEEDLCACVSRVQPDVIIIDMESPSRDTLEHMRSITRDQPKPIVMFAEDGDSSMIRAAVSAGVSAYIVDGLSKTRVKPILEVAIARFDEFQRLRRELDDVKTTLEGRKLIERAKGILMKQRGMSEDEAYRALRKIAMDQNRQLAEVARNLIDMAKLLG